MPDAVDFSRHRKDWLRGDHEVRHFIRGCCRVCLATEAARARLELELELGSSWARARARARLERWYVSHIPIWAFAFFFQEQANAASHAADAACHAADAASHAADAACHAADAASYAADEACHAAAAASHAADAASYAADVAGHAADASSSSARARARFEHGSSGGRSVTFPYWHLPVCPKTFFRYQKEWLIGDHGVRQFIRGPHRACRDFLPPGEGAAELEPNSSLS